MLTIAESLVPKSGLTDRPRHPLASTKTITIEMEYDADAKAFVTYVKELHEMSSFGETEEAAEGASA